MAVKNKAFDLTQELVGLELMQIQKKNSQIELLFRDRKHNKKTVLTFKGMLFETPSSALNKKVQHVERNRNIGFKALTQLRTQNLDVSKYEELLIQMQGNTQEFKIELLCVSDDFKFRYLKNNSGSSLIAKV